jgi:hypothetical protein
MDSSSFTRVGHPVVAALEAVGVALDAATAADVWSTPTKPPAATPDPDTNNTTPRHNRTNSPE